MLRQTASRSFCFSNNLSTACQRKRFHATYERLRPVASTLPARLFRVSEEIQQAVYDGKGIVSLESTVITHGMPWPQNVEVAQNLEKIIRSNNCVPATISVLSGQIVVGLTTEELQRLATSKNPAKISRRDLSHCLSQLGTGGTTVAATMLISQMAGIQIFATGGCGGVHREAETTFDISADIVELGRTPVSVVCAGIKSILDISKTLELLETAGVPVLTYGNNDDFPGFFVPSSGHKSQGFVTTPEEAALVIETQRQLGLQTGIMIAAPIQSEFISLAETLEMIIQEALTKAREQKVSGRNVTPFVLSYLNQKTTSESLKANMALIENNANVASKIAFSLQQIQARSTKPKQQQMFMNLSTDNKDETSHTTVDCKSQQKQIVVIGGTVIDIYAQSLQEIVDNGSTYPASIFKTFGGVGRNHADALAQLGNDVLLITAVGEDQDIPFTNCSKHLDHRGVQMINDQSTARYVGYLDQKGDVQFGLMDSSVHSCLTKSMVKQYESVISGALMGVVDGNVPVEVIDYFISTCTNSRVPVWFEPTDHHKIQKLFQANQLKNVNYISPNLNEFETMLDLLKIKQTHCLKDIGNTMVESAERKELFRSVQEVFEEAEALELLRLGLGTKGALLFSREPGISQLTTLFLPPISSSIKVVSASGGGDCLNAGIIHGIVRKWPLAKCCALGLECSKQSLASRHPVPSTLVDTLTNNLTKLQAQLSQIIYP